MLDVLYNALLPWGTSRSLEQLHCAGTMLGRLMWHGLPQRRRETIQTISERLNIPAHEAARIGAASFQHSSQAFLEIFHSRHLDYRFLQQQVEYENPELLHALASSSRPVVAAGAHFGCWELMAGLTYLFNAGQECRIIVRQPKNKALARVMAHMRSHPRVRVIPHRDAARHVLGYLRAGGKASFLVDHNCRREEAEFLPFLGRVAAVNKGPAILALRAKAEVWPVFPLRLKGEAFRVITFPPLDTATLSGSRQERITTICRFYTQAVETMVLRYPEQWFWMHRRWKTRPLDETSHTESANSLTYQDQ